MIFIDSLDKLEKELAIGKTHEIMRRIRKQPRHSIKPKERPRGTEIEKVELAEDKTIRMYVKGGKEPVRMYPEIKSVYFIAYYKRFIPLIIHSLSEMGFLKKIITLLAIKFNFSIVPKWFKHIFYSYEETLNDENYSQPVKEIRRVLKGVLDDSLVDALAMILEYDSAYRYRLQDILPELNKEDLLRNPAKEIGRLLDIIFYRSYKSDNKWIQMKKAIKLLFFLSPKIKKQVVAILKDINIDEVKFSKEDLYWINQNTVYLFRGMTLKERLRENEINYGE